MKIITAVHVNELDNCVTLTDPAEVGDTVVYLDGGTEKTVIVRDGAPAWHKIAVRPVKKGANVYKYGDIIGVALADIKAGDHVHIHNLRSLGFK